ncbi:unnamed protein product [Adineta steineri]|uniref:Poly [ADP-ribose] polymerase n=1 Tax=Adineta steineri TaxID=433720 RepID=A0A814RL00_9BILA|nr:unnamed protein product [Adineta steineri]CAF1132642.1 unnamed protein product [Adineta steineri]CAF1134661.1 unnamed protein product [Adineta steineri]
MSTRAAKKAKLEALPQCPYGATCYRKNPEHFKQFSHSDPTLTTTTTIEIQPTNNKTLSICPFGATCYRKNLLHFAEFSHPFNLLNPDMDSSDEEDINESNVKLQTTGGSKKRKAESEEYDDGDKTEEYNSDDESAYDVKLEKTFSKMNDDEKRLMIERAFELKEQLQEKLKKSREEAEERKKEVEQLQTKITEGSLLMEGEEEVLKGTTVKYFELFPERKYKQGSADEVHFRLAESQFYRLLSGYATASVTKVEYVCNPVLIKNFNKARDELKEQRGVEYSYPVLAFHGTAVANIQPICETGFKIPGQKGFKHATDSGYYGRGTYFSEYPGYSMGYIQGSTKLLLCQVLQGKVYKCTKLINGAGLQHGFDSHCSPCQKELVIFRSDYILPQYIVHYKVNPGEFKYTPHGITKEVIKKKLNKIGKLYKKAVAVKDQKIFNDSKFAFIGQMTDTPIAIETLIHRFGGSVCKNELASHGKKTSKKALAYAYFDGSKYDPPNIVICSLDEMEAVTPSMELQAYKNMTYQSFYREDFLYDSIIAGTMKPLEEYEHS